ncbi:NYN domain-containing protein [Desulfoluna sp.]|uniref:LabA-like NYN domain-containing protein n=1 Tax=Desulfoluna sp. TaxID=2045199 RepID=UPI0026091FBA|nr:NYN domain-containing protein [Desulfoluna sp.]
MLKAGIFLDVDNLSFNGGWGMRYSVIRDLVTAQDTTIVRANAYLAADFDREEFDHEYRMRSEEYRNAMRRAGFHLILKPVKRYFNDDGDTVVKANADLDLAVDALLQSENLDYVLIGTGDGDFLRLVRALQNRGKRVDLLSFDNTSSELRREVDNSFSGFLVPGLMPSRFDTKQRERGVIYSVKEGREYGFLNMRTGLGVGDVQSNVFCHVNDFEPKIVSDQLMRYKREGAILEFDSIEQGPDKFKAENISVFDWKTR